MLFNRNKDFMIPTFPFFKQMGEFDCGITCLRMIAKYYGGNISPKSLKRMVQHQTRGISLLEISENAERIGMNHKGVQISYDRLADDIPTPCIAFWQKYHFVVIYHVTEVYIWIADPATNGLYIFSREAFEKGWICDKKKKEGVLLLLEPTSIFYEKKEKQPLEIPLPLKAM